MTPRWEAALGQWEAWSRAGGHAVNTIRSRRYQLGVFADEIGVDDPWQVTLADMVTFLGSYPEWSRGTRFAYRQTLRSFFTFALDFGHVEADPSDKLPKMRQPKGMPHPTSDAAFNAALERADDRDRLILMLGAYAGLRRMEIAGLRWEHITATHLRIRGKGDVERLVPLHPELAAALEAESGRRGAGRYGTGWHHPRADDGGYVFPGRKRGHVAGETIGRAVTDLLGESSTHGLRHRFACKAYASERDLLAVQKLLGHAKIETTTVYAQAPDGALERAVLAAGGAL